MMDDQALNVIEYDQIHDERRRQLILRRRTLRDQSNPFELNEEHFRMLYRMHPALAMRLIHLLKNDLVGLRSTRIPPHLQILTALRFFASGGYQNGLAQYYLHTISQTSVSRIINRVASIIVRLAPNYIKFPMTREERIDISNGFVHNRIENIIALMDCFVVRLSRPSENEEAFYHYKHGHSMNVQIISDANYIIRNVRVCPGANNDRHVWSFSDVKTYLENLRSNEEVTNTEGRYYLLADNGYTPSPIVLTPIVRAVEGTPEAMYTHEHVTTRCKIEQTFGILTNVWRCISRKRVLHYKPEKVSTIIKACAVLHNFRRLHGEMDDIPIPNEIIPNQRFRGDFESGIIERNRIIQMHYT